MSKKKEGASCARRTSIGGQALIEGIMMRGPKMTAMAVRNPEGEIVLEKWETASVKSKVVKIPILRGVINFILSMKTGYKCLMRSAEIAGLEDAINEAEKESKKEEPLQTENQAPEATATEESAPVVEENQKNENQNEHKKDKNSKKEESDSSPLMTVIMIIATALGVGLSILLFIMLPTFIFDWCTKIMPFLAPDNKVLSSLIKSVFEGLLKIAILVGYMLLVTLMKDIRRTFQYHGAEHKTIFCYEHGKELTVENVRREGRFHPRCGTSFLILMLLVGIFVSFFIDPISLAIFGRVVPVVIRAFLKLLLLPLMMGIGYELIKFAGRHENWLTRVISAPGKWMQRITVLEPTDDMIECAITAFKEVIPEDESDRV